MKKLTTPTLTFELPSTQKDDYDAITDATERKAKVTFKQGTQVVFVKSTTNNTLTYVNGVFSTTLTVDDTTKLSPGVVKMELSLYMDTKRTISDIVTANVEDVLNTGWDDWE